MPESEKESWKLDQLLKSRVFHRKLHEWGLIDIAMEIETIKGEQLDWNKSELKIDENAWNKVIHRGIKPIRVFAHPHVLIENSLRVSYYRMLAMVSQKSMGNVGLSITKYEANRIYLSSRDAIEIAKHLNEIISDLINADKIADERELDLWRGMTAGSQAQGSWQNEKGKEAAKLINDIVAKRIESKALGKLVSVDVARKFQLNDGRQLIIASEPDIGIYDKKGMILVAVEIKGGIDTAGVLERLGASLKSLSRAKRENPQSITILVLPSIAMTTAFLNEVTASGFVDQYFAHEKVIKDEQHRDKFFSLLGI
jgi:hypothetical protein